MHEIRNYMQDAVTLLWELFENEFVVCYNIISIILT